MSDSVIFTRRNFLKLAGIGVDGAAAGCAKPPAEKLMLLPHISRRTKGVLGPLNGFLVDG